MGGVAAATAMVALAAASPFPAYADIYDDQEKERKLKAQQKAEDGKKLLPKVLFGGTALSVPFFLPNLIRLEKNYFRNTKRNGSIGILRLLVLKYDQTRTNDRKRSQTKEPGRHCCGRPYQ